MNANETNSVENVTTLFRSAALIITIGLAVDAKAETIAPERQPSNYLRLGTGVAISSDLTIDRSYDPQAVFIAPPPTQIRVESDNDLTVSAAIGRDLNRTLSVEFEYRYLELGLTRFVPQDGFDLGSGSVPAPTALRDTSLEAHAGLVNLVLHPWRSQWEIDPFISVGAGAANLTWQDEDDVYLGQDSDTAPVLALKIGAEKRISEHISLGADVTRLAILDLALGAEQFPSSDGLLYRDAFEDIAPWAVSVFVKTRF
ncbi:MAG: hypothetical protein AAGA72_03010 [Pseudomonadota bacterium]